MKTFVKTLLFCAVIALCTSCKKADEPSVEEPADIILSPKLAIIKMFPEMQKYILATLVVDSVTTDAKSLISTLHYCDSISLFNPTETEVKLAEFAQSKLGILGTKPYILLDNGYAIVDWKWTHYQALSGEFREVLFWTPLAGKYYSTIHSQILNEEYYLLNETWESLTDLSQVWQLDDGAKMQKPEIRVISLERLSKYNNKLDAEKHKYIFDLIDVYSLYIQNPANIDNYIKERNSYQQLCVDVLNQMIENNDFEAWTGILK